MVGHGQEQYQESAWTSCVFAPEEQGQSPLLIASNTELIDSSGAQFMYELTQPEPNEKNG